MNGNLLSDGARHFAYDDENELTNVWVTNAWRVDYVYDGKLRRRIERDYGWNGSAWAQTNEIHFIYDGNLVVQERDANNLPQVTYTRGNDLSGTLQGAGGIGGLLARTSNSQLPTSDPFAHALYHADGNGNVTCLIYTNQVIAARYLYDPFGGTLSMSGWLAGANKYRFSSKEWNDNAGLYYYLYRFYDPNLQRWPNRDPLGEEGALVARAGTRALWVEPLAQTWDGQNLFVFVGNDPLSRVDYLGLQMVGLPGSGLPSWGPPPKPGPPWWKTHGYQSGWDCVKDSVTMVTGFGLVPGGLACTYRGPVGLAYIGGAVVGALINCYSPDPP